MNNVKPFQRFFQALVKLIGTHRGLRHIVHFASILVPGMRRYNATLMDGSQLVLDLREGMCCPILFHGFIPHEDAETKILKQLTRPGDIFVDVGANVGFYTAIARKWVGDSGMVIAFEPNFYCIELMKLSFSSDANVVVVPKALGSEKRTAKLYVPSLGNLATVHIARFKPKYIFDVEVIRLDDYLRENSLPMPSIIKIDVEGNELSVIQGMEYLITGPDKPIMAFECIEEFHEEYNASLSEIINFIQSKSNNSYLFYRVDYDGKLREKDIHITSAQNDIIAIPKKRKKEIEGNLLNA